MPRTKRVSLPVTRAQSAAATTTVLDGAAAELHIQPSRGTATGQPLGASVRCTSRRSHHRNTDVHTPLTTATNVPAWSHQGWRQPWQRACGVRWTQWCRCGGNRGELCAGGNVHANGLHGRTRDSACERAEDLSAREDLIRPTSYFKLILLKPSTRRHEASTMRCSQPPSS